MSDEARTAVEEESIVAVRLGHGANCSSIGSVVDTLFVTSLLGGAIFAAVVGALSKESIEIVGPPPMPRPKFQEPSPSSEEERVP